MLEASVVIRSDWLSCDARAHHLVELETPSALEASVAIRSGLLSYDARVYHLVASGARAATVYVFLPSGANRPSRDPSRPPRVVVASDCDAGARSCDTRRAPWVKHNALFLLPWVKHNAHCLLLFLSLPHASVALFSRRIHPSLSSSAGALGREAAPPARGRVGGAEGAARSSVSPNDGQLQLRAVVTFHSPRVLVPSADLS